MLGDNHIVNGVQLNEKTTFCIQGRPSSLSQLYILQLTPYLQNIHKCPLCFIKISKFPSIQRRRLVINIGRGKNLGHKYWGAKGLGKYIFRQHSKKIWKKSFYSKKFLMTFFLVIDNFLKQIYTLHSKLNWLPFLCIFLSLSLFLLSFMFSFFNPKNKKFLSDYWGGAKRGFAPRLNYWGRVPGLPPSLRLCLHIFFQFTF